MEEVRIHPLVYYQKPQVGNSNSKDKNLSPIQIIFPNGGFGLGIPPAREDIETARQQGENAYTVIASRPELLTSDIRHKYALKLALILLAVFNIILTCILYYDADHVDPSKVETSNISGGLPSIFQVVSNHRTRVEKVNFAFVLVILSIGIISAIIELSIGLAGFALALALNFLLGTSSLPYFVYSFRYIVDIFLIYLALVLRSRIDLAFLPLLSLNNHRL